VPNLVRLTSILWVDQTVTETCHHFRSIRQTFIGGKLPDGRQCSRYVRRDTCRGQQLTQVAMGGIILVFACATVRAPDSTYFTQERYSSVAWTSMIRASSVVELWLAAIR
jgi:hypothetical protein